jgi:hypothetical protein
LVVSSELDHLTPPAIGRSLATFCGADYRYLRGRGHNVLLEPNWQETASMVAAWLGRETADDIWPIRENYLASRISQSTSTASATTTHDKNARILDPTAEVQARASLRRNGK